MKALNPLSDALRPKKQHLNLTLPRLPAILTLTLDLLGGCRSTPLGMRPSIQFTFFTGAARTCQLMSAGPQYVSPTGRRKQRAVPSLVQFRPSERRQLLPDETSSSALCQLTPISIFVFLFWLDHQRT